MAKASSKVNGQVIDLGIFRETRQLVRLDGGARQKVQLRPIEHRKRVQCMRHAHYQGLIFPAIEFSEWSEVLGLPSLTQRCECGANVTLEVPFVTAGGEAAGLIAVPCSCRSELLKEIHRELSTEIRKRYGFVFAKGQRTV